MAFISFIMVAQLFYRTCLIILVSGVRAGLTEPRSVNSDAVLVLLCETASQGWVGEKHTGVYRVPFLLVCSCLFSRLKSMCVCVWTPSFLRYYPDFLLMRVNAVCPPRESRSCGNLLCELVSGRKDGAEVLE